jgi:hypothetical protein
MNRSRRMKFGALVLLLGVLVWTATLAVAQEADAVPRGRFEAQGIMHYADLPGGTVLIDGKHYRLSSDMQWYGLDSEESLMAQLLRTYDRRVGYILDSGTKNPTVKAIWVLPSEGR